MIRPRSHQHLLVQGGTVLTQDANRRVLQADVLITDGKISAVEADITPPSPTRLLDAGGMAVIPGLIQVGASLESMLLRPLPSGAVPNIDNFTAAMTGNLRGVECLVWGVTTIAGYELSSGMDAFQSGLEGSGIRTFQNGKVPSRTDALMRDNVDASAWLDEVTRGNAGRLGLEKELGTLEPGKAGDLVVLDMLDIRNLSHTQAPWPERILWSLKSGLVRWVVVDGEIRLDLAGPFSDYDLLMDSLSSTEAARAPEKGH